MNLGLRWSSANVEQDEEVGKGKASELGGPTRRERRMSTGGGGDGRKGDNAGRQLR